MDGSFLLGFLFLINVCHSRADSTLTIEVRSEGCDDKDKLGPGCGWAFIKVGGVDHSLHKRGHNVVVLDPKTGAIEAKAFDTSADRMSGTQMKNYLLRQMGKNVIVMVAVQEDGSKYDTGAYEVLKKLGTGGVINSNVYGTFALLGYAGKLRPTWLKQVIKRGGQGPAWIKAVKIPVGSGGNVGGGSTPSGGGGIRPGTPAPIPQIASCGLRKWQNSRIVGGETSYHGDWPWQALIENEHGEHYCGGTLIAPQWVVSASHCFEGESPQYVFVRLGAYKRTGQEVTEQEFRVTKIVMHRFYNHPKRYSNDIALLRLDRPAQLNRYVNVACLPNSAPLPREGDTCWVSGWGLKSAGGYKPDYLNHVSVPIVSHDRCRFGYAYKVDHTMICAGVDQGGMDACQGDSGGPLVCESCGRFYLHGVVSWGVGCGEKNRFGVYAKVKYYMNWLKTEMSNP